MRISNQLALLEFANADQSDIDKLVEQQQRLISEESEAVGNALREIHEYQTIVKAPK